METSVKEFTIALSPCGIDAPNDHITVWPWEQAPRVIKMLSVYGGDEDGAAWIPRQVREPYWLEKLWIHYGEPVRFQFSDGMLVLWAHS